MFLKPKRCEHCRFGVALESPQQDLVACHRFPPQILVLESQLRSQFPIVARNSFCGEFKRK